MRPLFTSFAGVLLLVVSYTSGTSLDQNQGPVWRFDLRTLGYGDGDLATVAFCGPLLLLYPDRSNEKLVFDPTTHHRIPGSAPCDTSLQGDVPQPTAKSHIVAQRHEMVVEQGCDVESCSQPPGKPAVRDVRYYLKKSGKTPVLLFRDHCLTRNPQFLADEYVLFFRCNLKSVVINNDGQQVSQLPVLSFPCIGVSAGGTRFAVLERDESFFHELQGTTDRARVSVFETSNGKKLFGVSWHVKGESTRDKRIALSDDGSILAVVRAGEVLVFALPKS